MTLDPLVDALACYRLTRLAGADVLTEDLRRAAVQWAYRRAGRELRVDDATSETTVEAVKASSVNDGPPPKLASLFTCRWCLSVYLGTGVVVARRVAPRLWDPVARALALSALSALLAGLEQD